MPFCDGREGRHREHAEEAVQILCEFCRALDKTRITPCEWPTGLPFWWARHQALDLEDAPLGRLQSDGTDTNTPERERFEREAAKLAERSEGTK